MIGVKTILLVENDLVALTMYSDRLAREGFHVSTAEDGETAIRQLETTSVDLVVLDLMLPRLSGAEVFKKMRSDQRLCNVPVIIFSNATLPEWPENIAVGPTKCLLKSDTTFAMLLETLHESLNAAAMGSPAIQTANGSMPVNNGQAPANTEQSAAPQVPPTSSVQSSERADFLKEAVAELPKIREDCFGYIKAPTSTASSQHLATLTDRIEALRTRASNLGCGRVLLLATPFHTLLSELAAKPAKATPSILQTIAQAVDCLGLVLRSSSDEGDGEVMMAPQALVVDDDPVSNQVNVTALQQASFETTSIDDPLTALEILAATEFDLIVLDINMPNLTGFEVCEKLRRLPQAKTTPVIFLTAFNNFENRKQSVLSGGGDFISKPVSVRELALKATIHLLKAHVRNARKANPETPGSAAAPQAAPKTERLNQPISSSTLVSSTESATTAPETSTDTTPRAPELEPVLAGAPMGTAPTNSATSPQFAPAFAAQPMSTQSASAASQQHAAVLERTAVVESELKTVRAQLETATSATLQAQTAREERAARCKQLEDEVASLRREHDELQTHFNTNRDAALQSEQKIAELQTQLQHATNELQSTKSGAASDAADRARAESELRDQIIATNLAADKASAALKEKEEWCQVLEKEIAPLRKLGETLTQQSTVMGVELEKARAEAQRVATERTKIESDLGSKLTSATQQNEQANARVKELEDRLNAVLQEIAALRPAHDQALQKHEAASGELERIKAELEKINSDRAQSESDLQQKLTASNQQAEQANARIKEHEDRVNALQQEIATLRPAHEQAQQKHEAATSELERLKADLDKINSDRARSESDLHQKLTSSNQEAEKANARAKEHEQRVHTLEQELATLRPAHDQVQQKHEATAGEVERLKADLEKTSAERTKSESELRDQLNAAKTNFESTASALKQKEEWCQLLEEEMAPLREVGEQLRQERQQKTDLERAKSDLEKKAAELEQKVAEHARIETDLRNQATTHKAALDKSENTLREKEEWFRLLEEELAPLRQVRHQYQQNLQEHQQTVDELARVKADFEKHNADRAGLEADLDKHKSDRARLESECQNLAAGKESSAQELARIHAELEKERGQRQHLEKRAADFHGRLKNLRSQFNDLFAE